MRLRAVTLDAAGTLIDVAEPVGVTYARVAARHGVPAHPDATERAFHAAMATAPPLAFPALRAEARTEAERAWWHAIVRHALGDPPPDRLDAVFAELFAHYARAEAWRVFPDVRPALARLRSGGARLAVISNFDGRLPPLLTGLGLARCVDAVLHSTAVGQAKPAGAIFEAACAALDTTPAETLHAGDSVAADVSGALHAGLAAVLVDRQRRAPPLPAGARAVTTLAALPAVVRGR